MSDPLSLIASIVGIGSGINNLAGGGNSGGSGAGGTYVPTGRPQIDQGFLNTIAPILQQIQQEQGNISGPVNAGYAGTQPGGQFGYIPQQLQAAANAMVNSAQQDQTNQGLLSSAGNQTYQTALDPQNALRNQLQQQVTDASRAGTSARGIGMSGEAAGIENNDVNNFLLQWQQSQLGRQLAGLQGMQGAMGTSGNLGGQAGSALGQTGQFLNAGAMFPFEAAQGYGQALQGPMSQFGGLSQQMLNYLGLGNASSQQALGNQQSGFNDLYNVFNTLAKNNQNNNNNSGVVGNVIGDGSTPGP